MADVRGAVGVVVGRLDPLLMHGVSERLNADDRTKVLARGVEVGELSGTRAAVAILAETDTQLVCGLCPSLPANVLVLAYDPPPSYGTVLLALGISCVATNTGVSEFIEAVCIAAAGGRSFIPVAGDSIVCCSPNDIASLTPRERDVLNCLSGGLTHAETALALSISPETVSTHASRLRRKIGMQRRSLVGILARPRGSAC